MLRSKNSLSSEKIWGPEFISTHVLLYYTSVSSTHFPFFKHHPSQYPTKHLPQPPLTTKNSPPLLLQSNTIHHPSHPSRPSPILIASSTPCKPRPTRNLSRGIQHQIRKPIRDKLVPNENLTRCDATQIQKYNKHLDRYLSAASEFAPRAPLNGWEFRYVSTMSTWIRRK